MKFETKRAYLYPILAAVVSLAAAYGLIEQSMIPAYVALVAALLGLGTASVFTSPPEKGEQGGVLDDPGAAVRDALGTTYVDIAPNLDTFMDAVKRAEAAVGRRTSGAVVGPAYVSAEGRHRRDVLTDSAGRPVAR